MKSKKIADQFASTLCCELNRHKRSKLHWIPGKPIDFGPGHQAVDAIGYVRDRSRPAVLVEIERRRYSPVSNVIKVWAWCVRQKGEGGTYKKPTLIQAFSGFYSPKDSKRTLAVFAGEEMAKDGLARYVSLPFGYKPRKHAKNCEGACQRQARRLARRILKRVRAR